MNTPSSDQHPIILFDGICNLCNSFVRWVIERDRKQRFRFASLQSRAGQAAIGDAEVGDSIVLIDDRGVHTRSAAALAIARGLGFPWSLAVVFAIVPRPIRDAVYSFIAARRYRWFGRQNACMIATPALRARFLDADEPPVVVPPLEARPLIVNAPVTIWSALRSFALRIVIAYFFIYAGAALFNLLPLSYYLTIEVTPRARTGIQWIATHVLGVDASVLPAGSGDTTFNYVETLVDFVAAFAIGIVWWLMARMRSVSARMIAFALLCARWYLGLFLLSYGWAKVIPLQFPQLGPSEVFMTYGDSSPMGILWRFVGASTAYQVIGGLAEWISGFLLLWRRTALLGALMALGVLTNVVALNYCYDVPVKLFSTHLLLVAIFIIAPDAVRLISVLILNLPVAPRTLRPFPCRNVWARIGWTLAKLMLIAIIVILPGFNSYQMLSTYGMLKPRSALHGVYRVESFTRDGVEGRANPDEARWVRMGVSDGGLAAIQRADGGSRRFRAEFDAKESTVKFTAREQPAPMTMKYEQPDENTLKLEGTFEGANTVVVLRKSKDEAGLLSTRGFHWINEYPFNR